ncbi:DUF4334 domain-containing protein [Mycolicibacterium litorale]
MIEYRGVLTTTLIYDQAPVLDYLRAVDRTPSLPRSRVAP